MLDPQFCTPHVNGGQPGMPGVATHAPLPGMHDSGQVPYVLVPYTALQQIPGYGGAVLQPSPLQGPSRGSHGSVGAGPHLYPPIYEIMQPGHRSPHSGMAHTPHPPAYPPEQEGSHPHAPHPQMQLSPHYHFPRPPPLQQQRHPPHMPHAHQQQLRPSSGHQHSPDQLAEHLEGLTVAKRGDKSARRKGNRDREATLEEARQRTIYASDIDKSVTEADLAQWFQAAGQLVDCRICSDLNACKRFAFIEFATRDGFDAGLKLAGVKMGNTTLKVSPSKTAIVPINPSFMPRDGDEVERCSRTVYINQIDREVSDDTVRQMFANFCGTISRFKMKADKHHGTRIAFIEFECAEAAKLALGMCGAQLGSSQLRVSPSKTPVRMKE